MTNLPQLNICDQFGQVHISINADGKVTGFCGHVDLGQGIEVALAQIVAEELDLALHDVTMVLGNTKNTPDQGPTIASETIQVTAIPLRRAAATLRHELARRAALQLNVAVPDLTFEQGYACVADRKVAVGALIKMSETDLLIDEAVQVKDPATYKVVGQKTGRRDLLSKVDGSFTYIHDVKVDGMLHGHVIRPPYSGRDSGPFVGTSLIGYDEAAISNKAGFVAVVREGDFLGVVATEPDIARSLAEELPVHWRMPPELPDMGALRDTIRDQPSTERVLDVAGDIKSALHNLDKPLKRSYVWPYQLHGSIGPSCAVADWANGAPVVWCGSQNPHMLRGDLAQLVGLSPEEIDVRRFQAAGCYGRNCADDVAGDALIMSRAVGRPVRVQLTRAQENLWEPKGAAQIMDVEGGLKDGRFYAYRLDTWYPSNRGPNLALLLTGVIGNHPQPVEMGDRTVVPPYVIPHKRITVHDLAPIVRASWFRGVSALPNTFAHECFIDELAFEAGVDPVAFRLEHIEDPRTADLIQRTAEAAGWDSRTGPRLRREGRMAYGRGFAHATYVHGNFPGVAAASAAWVCDVAVDTETGEVTLTRVFVGQDQGLVINPDGVRQQIHGNVHQTAGRVLSEQVTFDSIEPTQKSWGDYPIMTFPQAPEIETMLIERPDEPPLGVGESAAVPSASAIANAIFDATGVRLREVPFTPERMRSELQKAGYAVQGDAPIVRNSSLRKRMVKAVAAIGGALAVGAVAMPLYRPIAPISPPPENSYSASLLARGQQVFAAGNCIDCHTAPGGAPGAGGKAFETPFGTIYSSNITSDPETGLGSWSFEAFNRAMRKGISRDGSNLYPAFPYTSFAGMSEDDMFAVYAYIQSLPAVEQSNQQAQMTFPANLRSTNVAWNWMFHDQTAPLEPVETQNNMWNRGRYLVETVGHCSACHTPRNALGAEKTGEARFTGAMVNGWYAPPLVGPDIAARGWDASSLSAYLKTGHVDGIAAASGPMAEVVANLQVLPESDIHAMSVYLESLSSEMVETPDEARIAPVVMATVQPAMLNTKIHRVFETSCASCHEPSMAGMFTAAKVPLAKSMAIRAPSIEAVKTIISQGLKAPNNLSLSDMPSFAEDLSAAQIDELARYLRARYAPDLDRWSSE